MSRVTIPEGTSSKRATLLAIAFGLAMTVSCNNSQQAPNDAGVADGPRESPLPDAALTSDGAPEVSATPDGADAMIPSPLDAKPMEDEARFDEVGLVAEVSGDVARGLGDGPDAPADASSATPEAHLETPPYTKQDAVDAADVAGATTVDAVAMPDLGARPDGSPAPRWLKIASSAWHSCAIRDDRTLWCWGDNSNGMLGEEYAWKTVPTRVQETSVVPRG
jgi:hypothetical protein